MGKQIRVVLALLALTLAGCPRPASILTGEAPPAVEGQVDFSPDRTIQATVGDVAKAATVSLINPALNKTEATSVTDASGSFKLVFGSGFTPGTAPYFLEAVKGLAAGGTSNRVGAPAARVRSLIQWDATTARWRSISSGSVTVSLTTTALSVLASLRSDVVSRPALIEALTMGVADSTVAPTTPDTFAPGTSNLTNADFHRVYELTSNALTLDQDPFQVIFRASNGTYQRLASGASVLRIEPSQAMVGSNLTIVGHGFAGTPAENVVAFSGGVTAAASAVSADRTRLTVAVPAGACSGPIQVRTTTGDLAMPGNFLRISNAPLSGTRFVGLNAGSGGGNSVRILAPLASTRVTLHSLRDNGSIDYTDTRSLGAGGVWEPDLSADRISMFQVLSDKPVFVSYDNMTPAHGSDDEWACQTGTDYYFRLPATYGDYRIISHAAGNTVTVTSLNDASMNVAPTALAEGAVLARSATPAGPGSYWFRVQSTYPTTAIFGLYSDNSSTQVFSADMKTFYEAHYNSGANGNYQLVGYEDGTNVTVTNLSTATSQTFALSAGQHVAQLYPATGDVKVKVVSDKPLGFYIGDTLYSYDNNQHGSMDRPGSAGTRYKIVSPSRGITNVYVLSLAPGNTVTYSGGITGSRTLGELAWSNIGALAADTVLSIDSTQPIAVLTADNSPNEFAYTLLPY